MLSYRQERAFLIAVTPDHQSASTRPLIPQQKTSLGLPQERSKLDGSFKPITNEVQSVWHKAFFPSSTRRRRAAAG